jgi:metal-responsive CopG/Arc/MetJ family transcriptional regulator
MQNRRLSLRINITLPPDLLRRLDIVVDQHDSSRSALIRRSLYEWLERQPPHLDQIPARKSTSIAIDIEKPFKDHIKPGMSADELLDALEDYETAYRNQV